MKCAVNLQILILPNSKYFYFFQFVAVMVHGFQVAFYNDCNFPWQFSWYIAAHALLFFFLFSEFYIRSYIKPKQLKVTIITVRIPDSSKKLTSRLVCFLILLVMRPVYICYPLPLSPVQFQYDCYYNRRN